MALQGKRQWVRHLQTLLQHLGDRAEWDTTHTTAGGRGSSAKPYQCYSTTPNPLSTTHYEVLQGSSELLQGMVTDQDQGLVADADGTAPDAAGSVLGTRGPSTLPLAHYRLCEIALRLASCLIGLV